ncbi:glycerophosphodiester phosphodiesterase family protein [uncultured Mobiluncus sp.]|uniref:glycerophosphodiester phosphodiesterase family protein n=1 Tax=uncultured Mobiluncus sp. TaxID=293425 RepID=UPI0025CE3986|nr:glycerophosphodiester phosphodiesterase family protein [uncultured Mobiluncus sp.]
MLLAHRGAAVSASAALGCPVPENSRAAFDWAVSCQAVAGLETDIHATTDGVPVISHDPLWHAADREVTIAEVTWAELCRHQLPNGEQPFSLEEFLDRYPEIYLNIDAKTDAVVPGALRVLQGRRDLGRLALGSFSTRRVWRMARRLGPVCGYLPGAQEIARLWGAAAAGLVRPIHPEIRSVGIPSESFLAWEQGNEAMSQIEVNAHHVMVGLAEKRHLERLYRFGIVPCLLRDFHCALAVPETIRGIKIVTPRFVAAAHTLGCPVYVWTVNDASSYRRLVSLGVDGIYTDIVSTLAQTHTKDSSS